MCKIVAFLNCAGVLCKIFMDTFDNRKRANHTISFCCRRNRVFVRVAINFLFEMYIGIKLLLCQVKFPKRYYNSYFLKNRNNKIALK